MKEVKKCSISGISFSMETDAYAMLNEYIETLKKTYGQQPDGNEIIADIEARIAELILSTQDNGRVVGRPLIANIIAQLGSAEDISEESASDENTTPHGEPRIPRRLYRDMDNARLGGVCSGLATYFGVEVVWVRLACCLPLLLPVVARFPFMYWMKSMSGSLLGIVILLYMIMWFVVPVARSARQKLEANGEKITAQSIRDRMSNDRNTDVDSKAKPVVAETVTVLGRVLILLMRIAAAVIFFTLVILAIALIISLFVVMFQSKTIFGGMGIAGDILASIDNGDLVAVLGIVACLLPTLLLLYTIGCLLLGGKPNRTGLLITFLLWLATIISLPILAVIECGDGNVSVSYTYENEDYDSEQESFQDSIECVLLEASKEIVSTAEESSPANVVLEYPSIDED